MPQHSAIAFARTWLDSQFGPNASASLTDDAVVRTIDRTRTGGWDALTASVRHHDSRPVEYVMMANGDAGFTFGVNRHGRHFAFAFLPMHARYGYGTESPRVILDFGNEITLSATVETDQIVTYIETAARLVPAS
jgi:hypothetical protein